MTPDQVPAGPLLVDTDVLSWIAACALSVEPSLPVVTGNLRDFAHLAKHSPLTVIHPDLA
ncbi:MAG: hypothetical protein FWD74_07550 [Actinomycetia bacterium]|nr:hypothetical protein [Actinomycetes bacterium]